jgi:hypothetical protein
MKKHSNAKKYTIFKILKLQVYGGLKERMKLNFSVVDYGLFVYNVICN